MMRRAALALTVSGVLTSAGLHATVLLPAGFREIVNGSDIIAYGRVQSTVVEASEDRKRIDTLVTLQVGTYLKGGPGETLTFRVPGGQLGRYRNVLVGAPQFAVGEETVVFLRVGEGGAPHVFGLNQGVFRVRLDARTLRRMVTPPALLSRSASAEPITRGSPLRRPLALEAFGAQVQSVIAEEEKGR